MRNLGLLAGIAMLALAPSAAAAQVGATAGVPMQAGSAWDHPAPPPGYAPPQAGWHGGPPPHFAGRGDYRRPMPGWRVPHHYRDRDYQVSDWRGWGFRQPGPGMVWIRYYDDALLIDGDGRVVDCRYGVDWDRGYGAYAAVPGYGQAPGYGYAQPAYPVPPVPVPGTSSYRAGPNTTVTTTVTPLGVPSSYVVGGCGPCGGGGTVVTVNPGMAVTTTTTTTDYETVYRDVAVRRKVVRKRRPVRHYHRPKCVKMTCPIQGS